MTSRPDRLFVGSTSTQQVLDGRRDANLDALVAFHKERRALATIGLIACDEVDQYGVVITDADAFGEAEVEQLIGRVGRREHPSDAVLITDTTFERNPSRAASGRAMTFMPRGMRAKNFNYGRR